MERTTVVVVGAGQAGLATSACLAGAAIDHVVLDRAEVASAWKTARWDSLRLLTPNWMTRLPGAWYDGDDPGGFMRASEVASFLDRYAAATSAPVRERTSVSAVRTLGDAFRVETSNGPIRCRAVVVASGACGAPRLPACAGAVPPRMHQVTAHAYRRPSDLPDGRVLVVGASASGAQIADELARAGREVTLAAGRHTRSPRLHRGRDIHWWMDAVGVLDDADDALGELSRAVRLPSLQLVGSPERRDLDLATLQAVGVEVVGRLADVRDGSFLFSGGLSNAVASADLAMRRLLDRIDLAAGAAIGTDVPEPVRVPEPRTVADLAEFGTVVWATGFHPRFAFLEPDLLDRHGRVVHRHGTMARPGLFVVGMPYQRTRRSSFIDGAGRDAAAVVAEVAAFLGGSGADGSLRREPDEVLHCGVG